MNEEVSNLLNDSIIGTLGTINDDGSPWCTPVHFARSDDLIYWFSSENAQHSINIVRDNRVSFTIYSEDRSNGLKGIYVSGLAQIAEGDFRERAKKSMIEKLGSFPPHFEKATTYGVPIGEIDLDKTTGKCWYFHS